MADSLDVKLLRRSIGQKRRYTSIKTLYADKSWVDALDIEQELGGHTGCVNALSWSKSGAQLASGSDDTYLNIWDYYPSDLAKPFTLNTSVATGHHANIFSVKFMPHSNDRTVITCAGDSQVRVFDLEYGGNQGDATAELSFQSSTRSRRFSKFFGTARWLNETNTNARVYRSHADRAKRVVTESSPHLFLTCSEDGEVRQWDLRQPSSFYPAPRRARPRWGRYSTISADDENASGHVPPPLISYKRYGLDLNSISCSGSQPQYIALGGAHVHCFLHDRRMIGRDLEVERGKPANSGITVPEAGEDDAMDQATRCVRRFAPNNKRTMKAHDHGHITACKISDARPNEVIASWSGDHIYSFDIVKSPDAREREAQAEARHTAKALKNHSERKRKRHENVSSSSLADKANPPQRLRRVADSTQEDGQTALRVQYENGETSVTFTDIPPRDTLLADAQSLAERVAHALVKLRKTMFEFTSSAADASDTEPSTQLTPHTSAFRNVIGQCTVLLPQMDDIISSWTYPVNPSEEDVTFQNTLRRNRQKSWRFVQAGGALAKALGGTVQTLGGFDQSAMLFDSIKPANREERGIEDEERFCYDFLKAITLWISGGKTRLLNGFRRHSNTDPKTMRYPLQPEHGPLESFQKLLEYLLELASGTIPVVDLDSNEFLLADLRQIFPNQKLAVQAFMRAVDETTLAMNGDAHSIAELERRQTDNPEKHSGTKVMDKGAAARFWGVKVGRSLLMKAAEGVNFDFVRRAFGGISSTVIPSADEILDELLEGADETTPASTSHPTPNVQIEDATDSDNHHDQFQDAFEAVAQISDQDGNDDNSGESENDSDDGSDSDGSDHATHPLFRRRLAFGRSKDRAQVNRSIPYSTHTRCYRGHLNARTVKDVNYYGLDDEYIVSGSDDGNFFIWDRKTGKVLNILQGDEEVVNVVQGHPYEPMIAVSGIDSTVKIFGVGNRERKKAERGIDIANPGGTVHSSLRFGGRHRLADLENNDDNPTSDPNNAATVPVDDDVTDSDDNKPKIATNGLKSRKAMHRNYEIMNQNDVARREEDRDAFLTEDVLARVAAMLQQRRAMGLPVTGPGGIGTVRDEDGNEVEVGGDCLVM